MSAQVEQPVQSQQFTDVSEYQFTGNNVTVERKLRFITLYREHGSVYHAAFHTPVARKTVYAWLQVDEQFAQAFADSKEDSLDDLESSVYKRAFKDSILAMFYLKAHRPKFRDKVSVDVAAIQEEITERIQSLGLRELPALVTTTLDDSGDNHSATEPESTGNPQFPSLPASEQKE